MENNMKIHNDIKPTDIPIIDQYKKDIDEKGYNAAIKSLNSKGLNSGFRASLFNNLEEKIKHIQEYLLNKYVADVNEYYSYNEPTDEEMGDKIYWIQLY